MTAPAVAAELPLDATASWPELRRRTWSLAWPVIFSFSIEALVGLFDILMVGRLGATAVAGGGGAGAAGGRAPGAGTRAGAARGRGAPGRGAIRGAREEARGAARPGAGRGGGEGARGAAPPAPAVALAIVAAQGGSVGEG